MSSVLVDDVVDESDENEATEVDTENDTENEEDETGHKSQVTMISLNFNRCGSFNGWYQYLENMVTNGDL